MKTYRLLCLPLFLLATAVNALTPGVIRVTSQKDTTPDQNYFGTAVTVNDAWLLVGERYNDDGGLAFSGAVHVFNALTGAWVRKIVPTARTANADFGSAVAMSGNTALITANSEATNGVVYIFDIPTGKQLFRIIPPIPGSQFGESIAIAGDLALIGHPGALGNKGTVHVYSLKTGDFLNSFTPADAAAGDKIGSSLAADGKIAVTGAPDQATHTGAAYLFDARSCFQLGKLVANDPAQNDYFGTSVAIAGGRSLVSAPFKNAQRGAAYVFNNQSLTVEHKLTASNAAPGDRFGFAVALSTTLAIVTATEHDQGVAYVVDRLSGQEIRQLAPYTSTFSWGTSLSLSGSTLAAGSPYEGLSLAGFEGAAYLFKNVVGPMPYETQAVQGNYAPGKRIANYAKFGDAFINEQSETSLTSTLTGLDSNGGKDNGVFTNLTGIMAPAVRSRDLSPIPLTTALIGSVTNFMCNADSNALLRVTLTGTGITAANNTVLGVYDTVNGYQRYLRTGDLYVGPGSPQLLAFDQAVQSRQSLTFGVAMRFKAGVNNVTIAGDSNIQLYTSGIGSSDLIQEGRPEPLGAANYGQLNPRVAYGDSMAVWSGFRSGAGVAVATNKAVYKKRIGQPEEIVSILGSSAILPGLKFTAFLGESSSQTNDVAVKSTVSGTGVTAANNQMIYVTPGGIAHVAARTGDDVTGLPPSVKWKTFTSFWPLPNKTVLILGTVSGPGVNSTNDQVLALFQDNQTTYVLAREGDAAPGCPGCLLGPISRVDASMGGMYAMTASLVGSAADANLALYTGNTNAGDSDTHPAPRLPVLKLRKGTRFNTPLGTAAKVLSFSLPASGTDATGAGNKGLGRAINNFGDLVFTLQLDDGTTQIVGAAP